MSPPGATPSLEIIIRRLDEIEKKVGTQENGLDGLQAEHCSHMACWREFREALTRTLERLDKGMSRIESSIQLKVVLPLVAGIIMTLVGAISLMISILHSSPK